MDRNKNKIGIEKAIQVLTVSFKSIVELSSETALREFIIKSGTTESIVKDIFIFEDKEKYYCYFPDNTYCTIKAYALAYAIAVLIGSKEYANYSKLILMSLEARLNEEINKQPRG